MLLSRSRYRGGQPSSESQATTLAASRGSVGGLIAAAALAAELVGRAVPASLSRLGLLYAAADIATKAATSRSESPFILVASAASALVCICYPCYVAGAVSRDDLNTACNAAHKHAPDRRRRHALQRIAAGRRAGSGPAADLCSRQLAGSLLARPVDDRRELSSEKRRRARPRRGQRRCLPLHWRHASAACTKVGLPLGYSRLRSIRDHVGFRCTYDAHRLSSIGGATDLWISSQKRHRAATAAMKPSSLLDVPAGRRAGLSRYGWGHPSRAAGRRARPAPGRAPRDWRGDRRRGRQRAVLRTAPRLASTANWSALDIRGRPFALSASPACTASPVDIRLADDPYTTSPDIADRSSRRIAAPCAAGVDGGAPPPDDHRHGRRPGMDGIDLIQTTDFRVPHRARHRSSRGASSETSRARNSDRAYVSPARRVHVVGQAVPAGRTDWLRQSSSAEQHSSQPQFDCGGYTNGTSGSLYRQSRSCDMGVNGSSESMEATKRARDNWCPTRRDSAQARPRSTIASRPAPRRRASRPTVDPASAVFKAAVALAFASGDNRGSVAAAMPSALDAPATRDHTLRPRAQRCARRPVSHVSGL